MSQLANDEVALTVTSPPYWNAIDYDKYANGEADWKTREYSKGFKSYKSFLALMGRIFAEVFRVTMPGGYCAVIVGTVLQDKRLYPLPMDLISVLEEEGWDFHQDIIWMKPANAVSRAGSFVTKPEPGTVRLNLFTEYILVFQKPGVREATEERVVVDGFMTRELLNNVWHVMPLAVNNVDHPCPFPDELVYRLATLYSRVGDIILDPFMGSGTTPKVAAAMGRAAVGYDLESKFVEYAQKRLVMPTVERDLTLVSYRQADKWMMNPVQVNRERKGRVKDESVLAAFDG